MDTQQWQPIETAPKKPREGEYGEPRILLLRKSGRVCIGHWESDPYARREPRPFWTDEGLRRVTSAREDPPTHWMPLPASSEVA